MHIISGKWVFLRSPGESDKQRFRVTFIAPDGKCKVVYAMSAFSHDIKKAMLFA